MCTVASTTRSASEWNIIATVRARQMGEQIRVAGPRQAREPKCLLVDGRGGDMRRPTKRALLAPSSARARRTNQSVGRVTGRRLGAERRRGVGTTVPASGERDTRRSGSHNLEDTRPPIIAAALLAANLRSPASRGAGPRPAR